MVQMDQMIQNGAKWSKWSKRLKHSKTIQYGKKDPNYQMTKSLFGGYCNTVFHVVKAKIIRHITYFFMLKHWFRSKLVQICPKWFKLSKWSQWSEWSKTVQAVHIGPKRSNMVKTVQNGPNNPN